MEGNIKKVNKVGYLLISFFVGTLGIHKFYVGKIMWGIIYLCLSWTGLSAIAALIEFVMACLKNTDENGMIDVRMDKLLDF